jgi:hypothetical protein
MGPQLVAAAEVTGEAKWYGDTGQQCCADLARQYKNQLEGRGYAICIDETGRDTYIRGTARFSGYCEPYEKSGGCYRYECVVPVTAECREPQRR